MPIKKFRFESLLKLRESEQLEKKNIFLSAQNGWRRAKDELRLLERELADYQTETQRSRATSTFDAIALRRRQAYQKALADRRDEANDRLETLEKEVETKRAELNEAVKETKILQRLKEKTEENRLDEEKLRAERESDELATRKKLLERQKTTFEGENND